MAKKILTNTQRNSLEFQSMNNDIHAIYYPHHYTTEIKITINNQHLKAFHKMLTHLNSSTREHIKAIARNNKQQAIDRKIQKIKVEEYRKKRVAMCLYAHKLRLKHGEQCQEGYLIKTSIYKDRTSIAEYKAQGQTLYNKRKRQARNQRIVDMVNHGHPKKEVAARFGIKPPTVSNIIKKATL